MNSQKRTILLAAVSLVAVWLIAWGGFTIAKNSRMTAEKMRAYVDKTDLSKLSAADRAKALRELADKLNSLSPEDRRHARSGGLWSKFFEQMTEEEKGAFLEATMPTGFKQMIDAFEKLPEDKRKKAIDDSIKRMREARDKDTPAGPRGTNGPALSPELEKRMATIGLKTFYKESSAQMKAEVAPLLEEIQKNMESGRLFRGDKR
ncbi:MAG: hypothetical protein JWM68_4258 [Verrucomicrobiales bacterium]|nr:hypothetical protein [Verrucomicrobiales bacterium]